MTNSLARFKGGFHRPFKFEIVVGDLTVDLVHGSNNIYMQNWRPAIPAYKGGGTFQESPLSDGRQLVDTRFENVEEIISFSIDANDVDSAIYASRQLRIAFEECANYWTNDWNETIGYLVVQETRESNVRYATIVKGRMPEDEHPFGQLVWQDNGRCLWDGLVCSIEHLPWQPTVPGVGEAVSIGVKSTYNLVPNGSFEDWSGGNPDNWTDDATPTTTENTDINFIRSGASSLLLETSGVEGVYQDISDLWVGTETVTVWVYLLSGTATLRVNIAGTSTLLGSDSTSVTGEWVQLSVDASTGAGIRIVLRIDTGSGYWDDVNFELSFGNIDSNLVLERKTTADEVFVVNKHNEAQLTHVYLYNGSWSQNRVQQTTSFFLSGTAVDHAIYFGIETGGVKFINPTPFNNLVFDIGTALSSTGSVTAIWQYWNGAWTALPNDKDNTDDGTNPFTNTGVNSLHFQPQTNWIAGNLNTIGTGGTPPSITGLWIRCIITAASGTVTPATQQNRPVYTVIWPYIEVLADQVGGDIDSLIQMIFSNRSDDSPSGVLAGITSFYCGLRRVSRGDDFTAYLNISDEQNPVGVTAAATSGTFSNNTRTATGRYLTWTSPGSASAITTVATITIDDLTAVQYFGRYHAFLRAADVSGSGFSIRLDLRINNITRYRTSFVNMSITDGEVVDLGEFIIDPGAILSSELPQLDIRIQAKQVATTVLELYDLILLPVDEWAGAVEIIVDYDDSRQLMLGSINIPKRTARVKTVDTVTTKATKDTRNPLVNGPAILHNSGIQRLWIFTNDTGASTFLANFNVAETVQLNMVKRYLSARGND